MIKVLEAVFRHPIQLLVMLLVPVIIALGVAYVLPRSYQSSASLWALKRYEIIGATGPESNLLATPADTQVAALSEMLQSRAFALAVAKSTDVASTLKLSQQELSDPQLLDDALILEISQHVQVISKGYNLYEITYINKNAHVAYQVVQAVITEFRLQGQGFSVSEGQHLLQGYQDQLARAKDDADSAAQAESQYLLTHPNLTKTGSTPLNDPQYALLDSKRTQAQSVLQNLQSTIATLNQQIATQSSGNDTFFQTLDAPLEPDAAVSRSKALLTAGGLGAGLGLVASILYILILVRRDRAFYTALDLQKMTSTPILMQIPQLSGSTKAMLTSGMIEI